MVCIVNWTRSSVVFARFRLKLDLEVVAAADIDSRCCYCSCWCESVWGGGGCAFKLNEKLFIIGDASSFMLGGCIADTVDDWVKSWERGWVGKEKNDDALDSPRLDETLGFVLFSMEPDGYWSCFTVIELICDYWWCFILIKLSFDYWWSFILIELIVIIRVGLVSLI